MGPMDLFRLMGQAGKIKDNLGKLQENARKRKVEGASGGGLVKVLVDGTGEVLSVTIAPEAMDDHDALGPLIAAATNVALRKVKEMMLEELKEALGGVELPPGLLPGT
jgi:DNA-binding YbaB/EbfC family protein